MGEAEKVAIVIEECGGLDCLEALQSHDNEKVYEKALSLIENYFSEGTEEMPIPETDADGQIQFGNNISTNMPNGRFTF